MQFEPNQIITLSVMTDKYQPPSASTEVRLVPVKLKKNITDSLEPSEAGSDSEDADQSRGRLHLNNAHQSVVAQNIRNKKDINFGMFQIL